MTRMTLREQFEHGERRVKWWEDDTSIRISFRDEEGVRNEHFSGNDYRERARREYDRFVAGDRPALDDQRRGRAR